MGISFISWNINKSKYQDIKNYLDEILTELKPDILVFFESENLDNHLIEKKGYSHILLKNIENSRKVIKLFKKNRIKYSVTNKSNFSELVSDEIKSYPKKGKSPQQKFLFEEVQIIKRIENVSTLETFEIKNTNTNNNFLYAAIHMPSKLYYDDYDQLQHAFNYKKIIVSNAIEHENKIVVSGDFNMTPYDKGMTEPMGFFAFQNNKQVGDNVLLINGTRQLSFYNPSWRLLGDYNINKKEYRSGGSFFYLNSKTKKAKTWHLFDQVILTKEMLNQNLFDNESFSLFESSTMYNDIINENKKIDHLPVFFKINI